MRDNEIVILFSALGKILDNQDEILKHLKINKCDPDIGFDNSTEDIANLCWEIER